MFQGVYTALITPFKNGAVDFSSLEKLVSHQLDSGIQGFVVCGTTGESATMSEKEQLEVLAFVCDKVGGKIPIIFGSGSNSTEKTVSLSQKACEYPIDALLVVVPYYNKPPQQGLVEHFQKVADESPKPIVVYNVPGRTITALEPETVVTLSQHANIVGIKEADSDLNNFSKYKAQVPEGFSLMSGDDESCVNFCFLGGHGVISVCSHVAPAEMVGWISRAKNKDESVRDEFRQQHRWINSLYLTSNPIPVKAAVHHKGLIETKEMRLPLVSMPTDMENSMLDTMKEFRGLL